MTPTYFVMVSGGGVTGGGYTPDGTLPAGAVACTQAQAQAAGPWSTVTAGVLTVGTPPAAPAPTLVQQAATLLAGGLAITSTGTPTLNGTYSATPSSIAYVSSEMVSILANGTFTNGGTTIQWADLAGALHTVPSTAAFKALATALGSFVGACLQVEIGASTTLPTASATIA